MYQNADILYFCRRLRNHRQMKLNMEITVAAVMILVMLTIAVLQIVSNIRLKVPVETKAKVSPVIFIATAVLLVVDVSVSGGFISFYGLMTDLMPSVIALWVLSSSIPDPRLMKCSVGTMFLMNMALTLLHVCRTSAFLTPSSDHNAVIFVSLLTLSLLLVIFYGLWERVRNVKFMMKNAGVWSMVCIIIDFIYVGFVIVSAALAQIGLALAGFALLGGVLIATGYRLLADSKFIFWQHHERLIAESMKLNTITISGDGSRVEAVYKELYERIVSYFEINKPYLNSDLTINTIVKVTFSNKLYISRAISQFTGRNFCQFVNYYRVIHSIDMFRDNPNLKIHELANMSGFNSIVSYNMAFRLFMGENPSEWCRKEKSRILKTLKK